MAKVKMPLISAEVRGAVNGLVFNTWRGINYVKINTSPTGQGTAKRLAAQALLIQASQLWQGLGDTARAAWNAYAIAHPLTDWLGAPKRITGMNWFEKCTVQLLRLGNAPVNDPPTDPAPDAPVTWAISQTGADLIAQWDDPTAAGPNIEVFITPALSAGISAKIQRCQFLLSTAASSTQPLTLLTAPAIGRYTAFARVVDVSNGLVSAWQSAFADIT